jgi:hypothetical protein
VEEVCREFQIAPSTWARWLSQYGGMKAEDAKRLKQLEVEHSITAADVTTVLDRSSPKRASTDRCTRCGTRPPRRSSRPACRCASLRRSSVTARPGSPTSYSHVAPDLLGDALQRAVDAVDRHR